MLAMKRAVEGLRLKPAKVLVDGNRLPTARRAGRGSDRRRCARSSRSRPLRFWPRCIATGFARPCTRNFRNTASPRTRVTARRNTWRPCVCMAPAATTASSSVRWPPRSSMTTACRGRHQRVVTSTDPQFVTSAANALLKELRRLAQDSTAYRKQGRVWLEGDHLCRAALRARCAAGAGGVLASRSGLPARSDWARRGRQEGGDRRCPVRRPERTRVARAHGLRAGSAGAAGARSPALPSVILDRVQDAGNVGAILRSAAAFGFGQVLAIKGTAALWSPKVLRAGMGAHFGLRLIEGLAPDALDALARSDRSRPVRIRANCCTGNSCPGPAPGRWGTKGRASARKSRRALACRCASSSRAARSRSTSLRRLRSACTPVPRPAPRNAWNALAGPGIEALRL